MGTAHEPAASDHPGDAYDIVVLGGGSGGYACALRAAELGLRVALVEKDKLGGTCLHRGCIPTKALLHAAEVADTARHSHQFGVVATLDSIDLAQVHAYKDAVIGRLFKGLQGLVSSRDIDLVAGAGRVVTANTVLVGGRQLVGRHLVLATGSYARTLPGVEIGGAVVTSDQALALDRLPQRVVVLGGGVIGVEFASVFNSFGADVTIVEALPRLVAAEDEAIGKQLERAYRKRKITVRTNARVAGVQATDAGAVVELEDGGRLDADLVLVAVGRGPVSEGLGLEQIGVRTERGFVVTDERCRTSVTGVYA